jgi:hypothetical protein
VIVPGRLADAVASDVSVDFVARIHERRANNLTGWLGTSGPVADPIIVTTPLTGWFTCAAERGTGLAMALQLATELAEEHPVFFLGNTGHELDNYGVRRWLAEALDLLPQAVVHLGASLAAGATNLQGSYGLVPRVAASQPAAASVPGLVQDLAPGRFLPTPVFPGEGAEWHEALDPSVPLLSFAGTFPEFHTPDDVATRTTRPDLLVTAYTALLAGMQDLPDAT